MDPLPSARSFRPLRDAVLVLAALLMLSFCVWRQHRHFDGWWAGSGQHIQKIRIPRPEAIRVASLGYESFVADMLTLRAVQMFGAAWQTPDKSTAPIYEYFDTVTELDPRFADVYELGTLILSDDRKDHESALELLRKGVRRNHDVWRLPYLGIYTCLWGEQDPRAAREFLHYARRMPSTPDHVLRLEEFIERQSGRYYAAYDVNLGYYLRYLQEGMDAERRISQDKFIEIIDQWNRLELARAASTYHERTGEHPKSVVDLMFPEQLLTFEAPEIPKLLAAVNHHMEQGHRLTDHRDEIREASMTQHAGLPPDPKGGWYFIAAGNRAVAAGREDDPSKPLGERFGYFISIQDALDNANTMAASAQRFALKYKADTGSYPEPDEMLQFYGYDHFGGHFDYQNNVPEEDGTLGARFESTAARRIRLGREPRVGLRGGIENFPPRRWKAADGMPPYLAPEPSVWDYPEDAQWALRYGLLPGVPWEDQPEEFTARVKKEYIPPPDLPTVPLPPE